MRQLYSILSIILIIALTFQIAHSKDRKKHNNHYSNYTSSLTPSSNSYSCGSKKYCFQMTSCEEAKFYLKTCGLKRLDRDGDGIPCEKLCKWSLVYKKM